MKSYTHIAVVLDRSGSMKSLIHEIIGGFNGFLDDQKKVEGKATMTLVQFDNEIDRLATFEPIDKVEPLTKETYVPRGMTKLYDAIGLTVNSVKDEIDKIKDAKKKPDKVLVCILTDGIENSSQEYNTEQIKTLLEERQKAGWEVTFIGANQDAVVTGRSMGLANAASNLSFAATPVGASNMMRSLSGATTSFRCASKGVHLSYSPKDRTDQEISPAQSAQFAKKATFSEHGSNAGKVGGVARSLSLSPKQRSQISSSGGKARWSNASKAG